MQLVRDLCSDRSRRRSAGNARGVSAGAPGHAELFWSLMMAEEIMIVVAPVPGEKQAERYPGRLEVAREVIRCEAAGASVGHLHARDDALLQTVDPTLFTQHLTQIRAECPIIMEGSTGGAPEHTLD